MKRLPLNNEHEMSVTMTPEFALIFYNNSHIERGIFVPQGQKMIMKNPEPVSLKQLRSIGKALRESTTTQITTKGLIPENLLWFKSSDEPRIIWKKKEGIYPVLFSNELGIPSGTMTYPNLVFSIKNDELSVYLSKTYDINEETELYHVMLPNIHNNNSVCMGSARIKKKNVFVEDIIQDYEMAFFGSEFNVYHVQNSDKKNMNQFWMEMTKGIEFDYSAFKKPVCKLKKLLL